MKKFFRYLPWVLLGISILAIGILLIGINYMKNDAVQQIKNIKAVEDKFQATRTAWNAQQKTLKDNLDKAQAARDIYAEQLQAAEDKLACANKHLFKPDYINDDSMSKALSAFITNTRSGQFKSASPQVLWDGAKTALFTIIMVQYNSEVSYKFIVYHNSAHSVMNRVFDIEKQCWLDG